MHRFPEGFDHGVFIAVPDGSQRPDNARITDSAGEGLGRELGAVVGVNDHVCWFPRFDGQIQGIQDQVRGLPCIDCPANVLAGIHVEDTAALHLPLPRRVLGNVRAPQLILCRSSEFALDQVLGCHQVLTARKPFTSSAWTLLPPEQAREER